MRKRYVSPRAEKLEFDYASIVVTSGKGDQGNQRGCGSGEDNNGDRGHGVGLGKGCNDIPGHLVPDNNPKTAHPVFGGCW